MTIPSFEEVVRLAAGQGLPWDDAMRMQTALQDAIDALVREVVGDRDAYSGFDIARTSATVATIGIGRLYAADGKRYALTEPQVADLYSDLPVGAGSMVISFVVSGSEIDTELATRVFRYSADLTAPGNQENTATRRRRVAIVTRVKGAVGPEAVAPTIPAGYLEIGRIVVDQTGIVGDPEMIEDNHVPNLIVHADQIAAAAGTLDEYGEQLNSLRSDQAALFALTSGLASQAAVAELTRALSDLRTRVETPAAAVHVDEDTYETEDKSDEAAAGYAARIDNALRFPRTSSANPLGLFVPNDPLVRVHPSGLVLPAYTEIIGKPGFYQAAVPPIRPRDYVVSAHQYVVLGGSRVYWWYGGDLTRGAAEQLIRETGIVRVYDPKTNANVVLDLRNRSWTLSADNLYSPHYYVLRLSDLYSDFETAVHLANGAGIAMTYLNGALKWMTGLAVGVKEIDPSGPLSLLVCGVTAAGTPDLTKTYATGSIAANQMVRAPAHCVIQINPFLMEPGKRYAFVLVTSAMHTLACYPANVAAGGTLFTATDGIYWQADPARDLALSPRVAEFSRPVTTVELNAATLTGGMRELELAMVSIESGPAKFSLLGRPSGSGWRSLSGDDGEILDGAPDLLQLQGRWVGTQWAQAGVYLSQSRLVASRQQTAMLHVSEVITLPSARTAIQLVLDLVGFDATDHTVAPKILSGASYATETSPTAVSIVETSTPGVKRLTASFTLAVAAATYKVKIAGATTDPASTFSVRRRQSNAS